MRDEIRTIHRNMYAAFSPPTLLSTIFNKFFIDWDFNKLLFATNGGVPSYRNDTYVRFNLITLGV